VDFFLDTGEYGFIEAAGVDEDVFFHMEDIGGPNLTEGTDVTFEFEFAEKGPKVTSVQRGHKTLSTPSSSSAGTSSADITDPSGDTEVYDMTDEDNETTVYDPSQSGSSNGSASNTDNDQQSSPGFCPDCGADLSSYPDGAFCPDCDREL
jgi:CspA family cold shock protein